MIKSIYITGKHRQTSHDNIKVFFMQIISIKIFFLLYVCLENGNDDSGILFFLPTLCFLVGNEKKTW